MLVRRNLSTYEHVRISLNCFQNLFVKLFKSLAPGRAAGGKLLPDLHRTGFDKQALNGTGFRSCPPDQSSHHAVGETAITGSQSLRSSRAVGDDEIKR